MARALEGYGSWINAYKEWTVPRSEAPTSYILWAGFYTLASAVKRHVYMPARLMGSYEIFPNLYVVFVGPPGGPRKSTTITYAKDLLLEVDHVNIASTATSASKLIDFMEEETDDGSVSIMSSELGSFVNVSKEEMYDVLTDIFDNPTRYVYSTRMHGTEEVHTPTINLLAATTPSWINEQMPPYVIGGGFASRCIFIYEPAPRRRKMYYDDVSHDNTTALREGLIHDLRHIGQLRGSFKHESEKLKDEMEEWYEKESKKPAADERIEGYLSRKHIHVHKLAMLLSVAESDSLIISRTHFEAAKELLGVIEDRMPRVFSSVGRNPYSASLERVFEYIQLKGEVHFGDLMARFYHDLDQDELHKILSTLEQMAYVRNEKNPDGKKKGRWFYAER